MTFFPSFSAKKLDKMDVGLSLSNESYLFFTLFLNLNKTQDFSSGLH